MTTIQCFNFLVSGRVQGVGYRAFVKKQANLLQLAGWVRNLADGRVELVACGDEASMNKLMAALKRGPWLAKVENIDVKPVLASELCGSDLHCSGDTNKFEVIR